MILYCIDPGPVTSGFCVLEADQADGTITGVLMWDNKKSNMSVVKWMRNVQETRGLMCVEKVQNYGNIVGAAVFETCVWSGRFIEACGLPFIRLTEPNVKLELCDTARTNDSTLKQAAQDKCFKNYGKNGRGEASYKGTKAHPGPLFGVSGPHTWSAVVLGCAVAQKLSRLEVDWGNIEENRELDLDLLARGE